SPKDSSLLGITGFRYWTAGNAAGAELDSTKASEGTQSIKLKGQKGMGIESSPFSVQPGQQFKAAVDVNLTSLTGNLGVWLRWYNGTTALTNQATTITPDNVALDTWKEYVVTGTAPENATA